MSTSCSCFNLLGQKYPCYGHKARKETINIIEEEGKKVVDDLLALEMPKEKEFSKQELLDLLPEEDVKISRNHFRVGFNLGWNVYRQAVIEKIEKL